MLLKPLEGSLKRKAVFFSVFVEGKNICLATPERRSSLCFCLYAYVRGEIVLLQPLEGSLAGETETDKQFKPKFGRRSKVKNWILRWVAGGCKESKTSQEELVLYVAGFQKVWQPEIGWPWIRRWNRTWKIQVSYRFFFLTGTAPKILSIRLHSKSHQKSSKCQNLLTEKTCDF